MRGGTPKLIVTTARQCLSRRERCLDKHCRAVFLASYRGAGPGLAALGGVGFCRVGGAGLINRVLGLIMVGMETVVDEPVWVRRGAWVVCPGVGVVVGWGVQAAAGWISALSWFPAQGVFRLVHSVPQPWRVVGAVVVGGVLGLAAAWAWAWDRLVVTVSDSRVTLARRERRRRIDTPLTAVFVEDGRLVLLGADDRLVAREKTDLSRRQLADAFLAHGRPWLDEPPPER